VGLGKLEGLIVSAHGLDVQMRAPPGAVARLLNGRDETVETGAGGLAPVKRNDGDITVTLRGLRAGTFLVSSFHVDPDFDQCPAIEVYVTDDVGTDVLQSTLGNADIGVGGVGGLITDEVLFTSNVFQIVSNGTDDVILRFNGTGNDLEVPLNGLAFQLVTPEPGTVTLLALGGLGALLRRRRSRRA
jgi:hypothetical protein